MQECLDRISASKKNPSAVPVEEPSSDNNTMDRISPSAMPMKKRPAKKTVQDDDYQTTVHQILLHLTLRNSSS